MPFLTIPCCCPCCSQEDSASADAKPAKPEKPVEPAWRDEDTDVVHLTGSTFREFIQTHSSALVMFYAPCKLKILHAPAIRTIETQIQKSINKNESK